MKQIPIVKLELTIKEYNYLYKLLSEEAGKEAQKILKYMDSDEEEVK